MVSTNSVHIDQHEESTEGLISQLREWFSPKYTVVKKCKRNSLGFTFLDTKEKIIDNNSQASTPTQAGLCKNFQ